VLILTAGGSLPRSQVQSGADAHARDRDGEEKMLNSLKCLAGFFALLVTAREIKRAVVAAIDTKR
jgi:hypothetical protein